MRKPVPSSFTVSVADYFEVVLTKVLISKLLLVLLNHANEMFLFYFGSMLS